MPGVKGMRGHAAPPTAFKPGHTVQPTAEQRWARKKGVAAALRAEIATIEPAEVVAWIREAVAVARAGDDAKAMLTAAELVILYQVGKPREQLSEREGIDMIAYIEEAARQMSERTIEGKIVEDEEQNTYPQE